MALAKRDRQKRYDDNTKKLIVQAVRLYEKGDLSKEALKAIIDLLPETQKVEAKSAKVSDLLEQLLNNP